MDKRLKFIVLFLFTVAVLSSCGLFRRDSCPGFSPVEPAESSAAIQSVGR